MGIVKTKRRLKVVLRATKNPLRPRNKPSHAPDAVSREYRGKIVRRKDYFAHAFAKWTRQVVAAFVSNAEPNNQADGISLGDMIRHICKVDDKNI